jgi:hypothetical protein
MTKKGRVFFRAALRLIEGVLLQRLQLRRAPYGRLPFLVMLALAQSCNRW